MALVKRLLSILVLALASTSALAQVEDVPFVVTPDQVTREMLLLAGVKRSDVVLDLGSGDGRIVITAAKLHGARGLGVEIVPELVEKSRDNARRAGVAKRAEFRVQDLFKTDLSRATVITMYLLPEVNLQLRPALLALKPGTRIVSHDWDMGDWKPDRSVVVDVPDKAIGRDKFSRLHLWTIPARVQGRWCGPQGQVLDVTQRYQQASLRFSGSVPGTDLAIQGERLGPDTPLELRAIGGKDRRLLVRRAQGAWAALAGARFTPAPGEACR
jgi:SAM-dependent methyltransferase